EYAALSYVWGAATETPIIFSGSRLPADIPLVVADAISVCLQLGLQYLWVDRYCILQDDAETKDAQIRNMNLIYKQAELTI
ncbi:heterokaryon incompatibility, partial [Schizothecium vesticola]